MSRPFKELLDKMSTDSRVRAEAKSRILKNALTSAQRLHDAGFMDDETMQAFEVVMREDEDVLRTLADR